MGDRILIVEDSPTQAEALRLLLVNGGFDVTTARSGEDALRMIGSDPPFGAILSDILMPGMSGYELCRAAKEVLGADAPPIILLTTLSDPADIVRGLECGADNYITKPYDPGQLLQRLRHVLGDRGARRTASGAVDVEFMGERFSISAEKEQILDMLLSSFEELVHTADELRRSRRELAVLHARAEDRAERLARLQSVTEALSRAGTAAEVVHVVVTTAREVLDADAGFAAIMRDETSLEIVEAVGYSENFMERWGNISIDANVPIAEAVRSGNEVVISSRDELIAQFEAMDDANHEAMLTGPFVVGGRILGAWAISFLQPRAFEEIDRRFFQTLTRQCAQALDRARLYEAERTARAEAEDANRAKAQFLAAMSHDLRTPLNAIGGYVDLIEMEIRGPITEQQRSDLARIKKSQQFLLSLINDVLNFAKLEAGTVAYDITTVPLGTILRDVELMVSPQMEAKGIRYTWKSCEPDIEIQVDQEKLQQVLLNLAGNALKFTPSGGEVSITCKAADAFVKVIIADTGIGIPPEKLDSIFDPFVQVHREVDDAREGIGLGLAISRDLVLGMGGELTVESEVGEGSVFTLSVPTGRSVDR
jgi:signal transduction histidine kinase/DNA-binding response OmpR family regulator